MIVFVKSSFFLQWTKHECSKLELQMTSAQFKGNHFVYMKSFKTSEKASFSEKHQLLVNNGYDFQACKNLGNHTMKTSLTFYIHFWGLMNIYLYSLTITLFVFG